MTTMVDNKLIIESEPHKQVTGVAADCTINADLLTALKRPLSAYNIYFQLERKRLLDGDSERAFTFNDAIQICDEQRLIRSLPKAKRRHRTTHGKLSFQQMARGIADSWKALDINQRQLFEDCAAMEKKKYLEEKKVLKKAIASQGGQIEAIAAVSPVAEQKVAVTESEVVVSKCSLPQAEHEELVSEVTSSTPCAKVDDDSMMDDLEPIDYKQAEEEDEHDVFYHTHQNLMHNLMIIKERQAILQIKEQSLKLMVQEHRMLQQIRNGRRRNSTGNPLRATEVDQQMKSLKTMLYNSPTMSIAGLFNKVPMKSFGHVSMNSDINDFFDYPYDDANDSVTEVEDDIFARQENTFLSSPSMLCNKEFCSELPVKGYGQDPNSFDIIDCFDNSDGNMDDSYDAVYDLFDDACNIANNGILSRAPMMNNAVVFEKPRMKTDEQKSINVDINYSSDQSYERLDHADDSVNYLADDILKIADDMIFSS